MRAGVVVLAAASVALLASLVAVSSTKPMGALGAFVVRLDLASPLVVAVSTFVLALVLEGPTARARVPRLLAGMWTAWLMALVFIVAVGDVRPSIERLMLLAVTMRPWDPGFPQTATGSLVLTAALVTGGFLVLIALLERTRRENNRDHGQNSEKLDRIEDKLDEHIGDHARANINGKTQP